MNNKSIFAIVCLALCIQYSYSFMFEVRPADEKCLTDEYRRDTLVKGSFEISDKLSKNLAYPTELVAQSMQMKFYIRDSHNSIVFSNQDAKSGKFAFTAHEAGEYLYCFLDSYRPHATIMPLSRTVSLEIKTGADANDYQDLITKGTLKPSEVELKKIEAAVDQIKEEIVYMKGREETMRNTNESTNARVAWLAVFTIFVLFGTAIFQITYLKRYFKQRKLI
ncbi:emp24/gp25L/p24 family protein [Heterostelium album PN500]|uniref:Emp24/gp25L/p24 family protein n=1 Tax=Heterostelium pallidum (strain ATCC 26659 / Pp 5 / PN500) TaxID=670386 RepID=D3AWD8_HETP5|nr:emp24/gp25L/p24 family protein [Heterostelium album PN500]EFA86611.1 emp24/gp25L/p24 family protein [Heterostelium album PN500]|eukprot:XP_020438716.1 emp24/gp25L/p24 family protein [Heterostelium album PN500]